MKWHPSTELQFLKGVGPKYADFLRKKGLFTFKDLIEFYPRTYQDQSYGKPISDLQEGESVSLNLSVVGVKKNSFSKFKSLTNIVLTDGKNTLDATFFKSPYRGYFNQFEPQAKVQVSGKVKKFKNKFQMSHPEITFIKEGTTQEELELAPQREGLVPIYSESERLSQKKIHQLIETAFKLIEDESKNIITTENPWHFSSVPKALIKKYKLMDKWSAIKELHFPSGENSKEYNEQKTQAHKSLIFEELFNMELLTAVRKQNTEQELGPKIVELDSHLKEFLSRLPFTLTNDQLKSLNDIGSDFKEEHPMHRLVQGDVGSGKTLVALAAAFVAMKNGYQVAFMAPTEILAEQHFVNCKRVISDLPITLLTGKLKAKEKEAAYEEIKSNEPRIVVGTHALFEDKVIFNKLGLVIVDEQHRFGVYQRQKLKAKGQKDESPHFLVMTATPIPRTLTMTVYGDLDVSVIEEMPPGRSPISTKKFTQKEREQALSFVGEKLKAGDQAYFVFPLVSESETLDLKSAEYEFEQLTAYFSDFNVGLLHGKMKPQEKERVMESFRKNETQVLVSTTVIEVGVDVPNATVMVIENCERFGLSQLHQLRGRVGRGKKQGNCFLILGNKYSKESAYRAHIMESTTNGFKIAEEDLLIRGPGEVLGSRQSGLPDFKLANLMVHQKTLMAARKIAFEVAKDPAFKMHMEKVIAKNSHKLELTKIG